LTTPGSPAVIPASGTMLVRRPQTTLAHRGYSPVKICRDYPCRHATKTRRAVRRSPATPARSRFGPRPLLPRPHRGASLPVPGLSFGCRRLAAPPGTAVANR
jgi:hypothetical protein